MLRRAFLKLCGAAVLGAAARIYAPAAVPEVLHRAAPVLGYWYLPIGESDSGLTIAGAARIVDGCYPVRRGAGLLDDWRAAVRAANLDPQALKDLSR